MSSDLWKVENVYYPPTIRETALSSSEARDAPEEAKAARLEAVLAITAPNEPARESEPFWAAETSEGLNPEAPRRLQSLQPHAEELALLVEPLQVVPPGEGCKDLETTSTQLSKEGIKTKPKK